MKNGTTTLMPLKPIISFDILLQQYDKMLTGENKVLATHASEILKLQEPYPILRAGFQDFSLLETHKNVIAAILQDSFSPLLSDNEIKAASLPYQNIFFNPSNRFKKILQDAGPDYMPTIRNQEMGMDYILGCVVILNFYYGFRLDFSRSFFYDIPDAQGVMRHYRILYNADFLEILPTDITKVITQQDVDELLDHPYDVALWMDKIPPESFISKGFVISNMFDVTTEQAISEMKTNLIANDNKEGENFTIAFENTFRSFFSLADVKVGFVNYNAKEDNFEAIFGNGINSYILGGQHEKACNAVLCQHSYSKLIKDNAYFTISDVTALPDEAKAIDPYKSLLEQGLHSAIFAPIASKGKLLGVLEIVSETKHVLNGVNAKKLDDVMPYLVSAVVRSKIEEENLIDAVIQNECTSVHDAVYWKFQEEAKKFIKDKAEGKQPSFKEIVFKDIHPLYGQIDIKDSSKARNAAIQRDLMIQLSLISDVLERGFRSNKLPIYEELLFRVNNHLQSIKDMLYTSSEQAIIEFVTAEIEPAFLHLKSTEPTIAPYILAYEEKIDSETNSYYDHRKNYDESVMLINKRLAAVLDKKQEAAQDMFPHFFERYKTDGVEHNMYIGSAISNTKIFIPLYLHNLRLWQLQVMCDMENEHYALKPELSLPLDTASLILVHNTSLAIRFRMDEKQFDVDGTYNARYEVVKKRIDKSYVKGTRERLTQPGMMTIVYSQKKDELEYLRYIAFLRSKNYFTNHMDIVELEGLQGVSGLKAIRVQILYTKVATAQKTYTYEDLIESLKE